MRNRRISLTERELQHIVEAAVAKGVQDAFTKIGIDISTPAGVIQAQRDWDHLRGWRKASDAFKKSIVSKAAATVWTLIAGAIGLLLAANHGLFSR